MMAFMYQNKEKKDTNHTKEAEEREHIRLKKSDMNLTKQKCVPCQGGIPPLPFSQSKKLLKQAKLWTLEGKKITRIFKFKSFVEVLAFVNKVGALAQAQGHHPDIYIFDFSNVRLDLWTHKIGGLHLNDFIMAAKINKIK